MSDAFTKMVQAGDYTKLVADALQEAATDHAPSDEVLKLAEQILELVFMEVAPADAPQQIYQLLSSALQAHGEQAVAIIQQYIQMLEAGHVKEGLREASKEETEFAIELLQAVAADIQFRASS